MLGLGLWLGMVQPAGDVSPAPTPNPLENGVHVGNDPADLTAYNAWLGQDADSVQLHSGRADESDFTGSPGWLAFSQFPSGTYSGPIRWSIPLFWTSLGANPTARFTAALAGNCDTAWTSVAEDLADRHPTGPINVRTGWEFNGNWQQWAIQGNAANYAATFQRFVTTFRAVSDRFRFEWCPNIGQTGVSPQAEVEASYPGDDYVDVIGMDFYYFPEQGEPTDPVEAWNYMRTRPLGINWLESFAAAHDKPIAFAEWGVKNSNMAPYVELAFAYMRVHPNFEYHAYWNSDADYPGKLSSGQYGATGTGYLGALNAPETPDGLADLYPGAYAAFDPINGFYKVGDFWTDDLAEWLDQPEVIFASDPTAAIDATGYTMAAAHNLRVYVGDAPEWAVFAEALAPSGGSNYTALVAMTRMDGNAVASIHREGDNARNAVDVDGTGRGTQTNFSWMVAGDNIRLGMTGSAANVRFKGHQAVATMDTGGAHSAKKPDTVRLGSTGTPWGGKVRRIIVYKEVVDDAALTAWNGSDTLP